jgi:hypothetical protein
MNALGRISFKMMDDSGACISVVGARQENGRTPNAFGLQNRPDYGYAGPRLVV